MNKSTEQNSNVDQHTEQTAKNASKIAFGQFRISTLMSWTTVIIVMVVSMDVQSIVRAGNANLNVEDLFMALFAATLFLFPAMTCIPSLIDKLLEQKTELRFGTFAAVWMLICVSLYSAISITIATNAFDPEWKGAKGMSWIYYVLDGLPGLTLLPIYFVGATLFTIGVCNPSRAKKSPLILISMLTNALISLWYVLAVFVTFDCGRNRNDSPRDRRDFCGVGQCNSAFGFPLRFVFAH